jgi:predicted dehydrogenase
LLEFNGYLAPLPNEENSLLHDAIQFGNDFPDLSETTASVYVTLKSADSTPSGDVAAPTASEISFKKRNTMPQPNFNRRRFLQSSAVLTGSLLITGTQSTYGIHGANDRLRIAVIGLNGRGRDHMGAWQKAENVEIAYLVDPDSNVLATALASLEKTSPQKLTAKGVADIRTVLEDPSVDAISIAAPNHWHSLMTIWAAQAGKHVYVEKPLSHDIHEGRVVVEAQKKYGVVIQHGTQRRSDAGIAGLHEALKSGKLPRLKIAYGYCCKPRAGIGRKAPKAPPANLDWALWKGPAVIEQYHQNYVHYNWHWFWNTGNGDMNNQGTHQLDVAQWAIDDDQLHPVRVLGMGGRFAWDDQGETPNTMFAMAEYANGQQVFFNVRNVNYKDYQTQVYNEYYLEDGSVITGESTYLIRRPGGKTPEPLILEPGKVTPGGNWNSFIAAVRAGDPGMANGNAAQAHASSVLGHLMNNSYRLGKKVPFSSTAVEFGNNSAAAEHFAKLHEIMQNGVGISAEGESYTVGPMLEFDPQTERHTGALAAEANALLGSPNNAGFEVPTVETV